MPLRPTHAAASAAANTLIPAARMYSTVHSEGQLADAPASVAILRALQLGDMMCAVPALRAVRAALPHASITLVGLRWARAFARRFSHYVDDFIEFPGWPGLPERDVDAPAVPTFLADMQSRNFDLALQLHGNGSVVNPILELFGAHARAGFAPAGTHMPGPLFMPYPDQGTETERLLSLTTFLGFPARGTELEFPLEPADFAELRDAMEGRTELHNYAVVHPGSRSRERRWDASKFARVGDALAHHGLSVVLTGTADERALTAAVAERMSHPAVDLSGETTLGALALLVDGARVVVSNDTGISHVAAARRKPSVIIFCASDPRRWAPQDRDLHRVVLVGSPHAIESVIAEALDLLAPSGHRSAA